MKKSTHRTATKRPRPTRVTPRAERDRAAVAYDAILDGEHAPKWSHVKQVRYVFWRMANGGLATDALRELCLDPQVFWNFVDKKQNATIFAKEYERAKILQARAIADSVQIIAEGRDRVSSAYMADLEKRIRRVLRRSRRKPRAIVLRNIIQFLQNDLGARERTILGRNKLQVDAAKWMAKTVDPLHYSDRMDHTISSPDGVPSASVVVQFVDAKGKSVSPADLAKSAKEEK